ncbi:protein of unknown function [Brochothrix thermosphacta]|uniref:Uncharacterized protein n=1 Tax=Brochothrix thermosphacta TaxID=2756 RepID=A0A2X0Q7Z6_BROTH|nr:hypothetical protein BTH160X_290081 [Brochothrix thermosphacta]SPN70671.1 protein of unknown function [Brochothrix thermosphacta]SPN74929.1 hypothetical protein BTEBP_150002 [Brochothrix thermosphacta]SPP27368.1 hypothetical protein BTTAP_140084 [Brochothrix thermosphacta]SPP28637.1 hypothetical protein BTBSAS_270001 [Brochothrix thermosphacta]
MVEHLVWDQGVAGSNPVFPIRETTHNLWVVFLLFKKIIKPLFNISC